jgi:MFS superfamily sulfate permease-like transporter
VSVYPNALSWLREYQPRWLTADLLAGATLAAYLLPAAIGDASLANLPPQAGLYACLFRGFVFWIPRPDLVVLDLSAAPRVDLQSAHTLAAMATEVAGRGIRFQAVEARSSVRDRLRLEEVDRKLGGVNRFTTVADVIEHFQAEKGRSSLDFKIETPLAALVTEKRSTSVARLSSTGTNR